MSHITRTIAWIPVIRDTAFSRKNVIVANRWHVRSRRSICCNPIIGIVEPALDVYICCWVCKMNLLMARLFSTKRCMSRLIVGYDVVRYTRTCLKLCPSYVKNIASIKIRKGTHSKHHYFVSDRVTLQSNTRKTNLFQKL